MTSVLLSITDCWFPCILPQPLKLLESDGLDLVTEQHNQKSMEQEFVHSSKWMWTLGNRGNSTEASAPVLRACLFKTIKHCGWEIQPLTKPDREVPSIKVIIKHVNQRQHIFSSITNWTEVLLLVSTDSCLSQFNDCDTMVLNCGYK